MTFTEEAQFLGGGALSDDVLTHQVRKIIEDQELLQVFQEIQQQEQRDGTIPTPFNTLLQHLRQPFAYTGGILLGTLLGVMALLFNFLVFNWILHMEF